MKGLEETRGTTFELTRHFFFGLFDSELAPGTGQWQSMATGVLSLLIPAGILLVDERYYLKYVVLSGLESPEPYRLARLADSLSLLMLVMAVIGLLTVVQWHALFPTRRDWLALSSLPIRPGQLFIAKGAALTSFGCLFILAIIALPAILFPAVSASRWQPYSSWLNGVLSFGVASGLACCFAFLALVALQGLLLGACSPQVFERLSVYIQAALVAGLLCLIAVAISVSDKRALMASPPAWSYWLPPVWFLGLQEMLQGSPSPLVHLLAVRAGTSTAGLAVAAPALYLLASRRYRRLAMETGWGPGRPSGGGVLQRGIPGESQTWAIAYFMTVTLLRSRLHRLVVISYLGIAVALALIGFLVGSTGIVFARLGPAEVMHAWACAPLLLAGGLVLGLRHSFMAPVELGASWVFKIHRLNGAWRRAIARVVIGSVAVMTVAVVLPVSVVRLGCPRALYQTALVFLASLIVYQVSFRSWDQVPFMCPYVPGRRPLLSVLIRCLLIVTVGVPIAGAILVVGSRGGRAFMVVGALLAGVQTVLVSTRKNANVMFDARPESDITVLDLDRQ